MEDRAPLRIADDYARSLGVAVFAFALLEANAVRCCERLRPGSLAELDDRTAGRVADTLAALARDLRDAEGGTALEDTARRFQALVRSRNNLLHAKPGLDSGGAVRLLRDGDAWSEAEISAIADAFEACSDALEQQLASALPRAASPGSRPPSAASRASLRGSSCPRRRR